MIASEAFPAPSLGGVIYVLRNDGYCWGRLVRGSEEFDVFTRRDHYDRTDVDAADAFIRAAKRGNLETPAGSWRFAD